MTLPKLNPLALFAYCLGVWAVWSNWQHVIETNWIVAAVVGAFVTIAWLRDKSIGVWLSAASALLFVAGIAVGGEASQESRILTSGACAGILAVMTITFLGKLLLARRLPKT